MCNTDLANYCGSCGSHHYGKCPEPPYQDDPEGQKAQEATPAPKTANDTQVGGEHYRSGYQHWDFVSDMGLDYYQAAASKYVTRWRKKNGLEDLNKAPHYLMKRAELVKAKRDTGGHGNAHLTATKIAMETLRLAQENDLDAYDTEIILLITMGKDEEAISKLTALIDGQWARAVTEQQGS